MMQWFYWFTDNTFSLFLNPFKKNVSVRVHIVIVAVSKDPVPV